MKYPVARFKSLALALKELEPFIRDGNHLQTGKPFRQLRGMRSREVLANWLICVAANFEHRGDRLSFTSDPIGGDGLIVDSQTKVTWQTEHVIVLRQRLTSATEKNIETRILEAVGDKRDKGGAAYATGKQLVVFLDSGAGCWFPNKVARELPRPLYFDDVWVVGLCQLDLGEYVYAVTQLDLSDGNTPAWLVRIGRNFDKWGVERIQ